MPGTDNSKNSPMSCWTCKHFQPVTTPEIDGSGECRALPPLQCCSEERTEPIWAQLDYGPYYWCSAFMQRRRADSLGTPPAPPQ